MIVTDNRLRAIGIDEKELYSLKYFGSERSREEELEGVLGDLLDQLIAENKRLVYDAGILKVEDFDYAKAEPLSDEQYERLCS